MDDRAEQQRPTTEIDCHGGPVPEVSGPPEATAPLARGGLPLQARRQRRLQQPSGTLSPPTVVISDSAFEEWLQSDNMEMPIFSQAAGPQQSAPTAVTLTAAASAAEAVTGTRVFPAVSSKGVPEALASSAGAALAAVPAAAPANGGTVFPTASVGGAARAPASADGIAALTAAPATGGTVPSATSVGGAPVSSAVAAGRKYRRRNRRPVVLFPRPHQLEGQSGTRVIHWSGIIGRGSGGDTVDRRYCCLYCIGGKNG